jgi:xylulokinase
LAPIKSATSMLGKIRASMAESLGLSAGTFVVVGGGDEHAACLGAGVIRPGRAGAIAGTAEPVCAASMQPTVDPTHLIETHCHLEAGMWLLENPGFVSGGNLRWYRDHFGAPEIQAAAEQQLSAYQLFDKQAAEISSGSDGLIFLPSLMGAMAPTWNEAARGAWAGFTLAHTRAHFTRALLEGSAYAVRDITDQMRVMGMPLTEMRLVGGGARSQLWAQIKANVTGLPIAVPEITETTALGAAMLALVGCGAYANLTEASDRIVRISRRFEPQPAEQVVYNELYEKYRDTYFALLPVFEKAARRSM